MIQLTILLKLKLNHFQALSSECCRLPVQVDMDIRNNILTLAVLAWLSLPAAAEAATLRFEGSGVIDAITIDAFTQPLQPVTPTIGGEVAVSFLIDDTVADTNFDETIGYYPGAVTDFRVQFINTDFSIRSNADLDIEVFSNASFTPQLGAIPPRALPPEMSLLLDDGDNSPIEIANDFNVEVFLLSSSPVSFESDDIPSTLEGIDLSNSIIFSDIFNVQLTSTRIFPVPEPITFWGSLFTIGLGIFYKKRLRS